MDWFAYDFDHPAYFDHYRDKDADGVFCAFTSWGYFATQKENLRQLQEFARVLKPGGTLLLDLCGREALERGVAATEGRWVELEDLGYRERVRWSPDRSRIWTERTQGEFSFRHDIWIPTDQEVRAFLAAAGFELEDAFGGLQGGPWTRDAERWIYRAIKQ